MTDDLKLKRHIKHHIEIVIDRLKNEAKIRPRLAEAVEQALNLGEGFERPAHDTLSARELAVMRRIASGRTVSEIAAELNLSVKTISTYRHRILEKMNLRNNSEIVRYAVAEGLTD